MIVFLVLFFAFSLSFLIVVIKKKKKHDLINSRIKIIKENYTDSRALYSLLQTLAIDVSIICGWSREKMDKALNQNSYSIEIIEAFIKEGREHRALYEIDRLKNFYLWL